MHASQHHRRRSNAGSSGHWCVAAAALFGLWAQVWPALAQAPAQPLPSPAGTLPEAQITPPSLEVISIQDLVRLDGEGESVLRGVGIVTGLKGTGDSGAELALARPLAQIYAANDNPLPDLRELAKAKSAALVFVEVTIPREGARRDDKFDAFVTTSHSAGSLRGGRLFLAPLSGPLPGQGVFAMASGPITIEDTAVPTSGRVRLGARMLADVAMPGIKDRFRLLIHPAFRSWAVADQIADAVNALQPDADMLSDSGSGGSTVATPLATAVDAMTIDVVIPEVERGNPSKFISRVLTATFSPSLLRLPAQVVVNPRTGSIIVTGNVEVSPVVIVHKDLVVTTSTPAPVPTAANPQVRTSRATTIATTGRQSERTRIQDLLQAFKQLDVPVDDQINILSQIHRTGRLHGALVVE